MEAPGVAGGVRADNRAAQTPKETNKLTAFILPFISSKER